MAFLETIAGPYRKARAVNFTTNGFPAKIPTQTEPGATALDANTATGASIIPLIQPGSNVAQSGAVIVPYGSGADNTTLSFQVIGWRDIISGEQYSVTAAKVLWVPVALAQFQATLSSTFPGVAGATIVATELFADTLTLTWGNNNVSVDIVSPGGTTANAGIAHVQMDLKGFKKIEVIFTTGGSVTDCNALVALL